MGQLWRQKISCRTWKTANLNVIKKWVKKYYFMNLKFLHLTDFNVTFNFFFHVRIWIHLARQLQVQMDPNSLEIKVQRHKIITSRKKGSRCYLMVRLYRIYQRYYRIYLFTSFFLKDRNDYVFLIQVGLLTFPKGWWRTNLEWSAC